MHGCVRRERVQVEGIARGNVDRAADTTLLHICLRTLENHHLADNVRRQHQVVEAARGGKLVENEPVCGSERMPVEQRSSQVCCRATQVDALAFSKLAVDDYARDALQCFSEILVWKLPNVLGGQGVDDPGRLPLSLERFT